MGSGVVQILPPEVYKMCLNPDLPSNPSTPESNRSLENKIRRLSVIPEGMEIPDELNIVPCPLDVCHKCLLPSALFLQQQQEEMLARLHARQEKVMEQRKGMEKFMLPQLRHEVLKLKTTDTREAHLRRVRNKLHERSRGIKKKCNASIASRPFTPSRILRDDLPAYSFGRVD